MMNHYHIPILTHNGKNFIIHVDKKISTKYLQKAIYHQEKLYFRSGALMINKYDALYDDDHLPDNFDGKIETKFRCGGSPQVKYIIGKISCIDENKNEITKPSLLKHEQILCKACEKEVTCYAEMKEPDLLVLAGNQTIEISVGQYLTGHYDIDYDMFEKWLTVKEDDKLLDINPTINITYRPKGGCANSQISIPVEFQNGKKYTVAIETVVMKGGYGEERDYYRGNISQVFLCK